MKETQVETIIKDAYKLYMPQVESEITDLTNFLLKNTDLKRDRPINVLEIGTKFGGTFYIWNEINRLMYERAIEWDLNGESEGKVCISIDMSDGGMHGGISDEEMDKRDLWFLERFDDCQFIRGDSHEDKTLAKLSNILFSDLKLNDKILIAPWERQRIDFLFIDGDHTYEGVKKDFYDYSLFCKPKSFVAFHDIVISDYHHTRGVYVGEFWNEIKKNYKYWEFIEHGNNWAGIGVIQLP